MSVGGLSFFETVLNESFFESFVERHVWQKKIEIKSNGLDFCVEKPSLLDSVFIHTNRV